MTSNRLDGVSKDLPPEEWRLLIDGLMRMLNARFVDIAHEDAEDAVQAAICRVLQTKDVRRSLKGLLRTVATNAACDQLRQMQYERLRLGRRVPLDDSDKVVDPSKEEKHQLLLDGVQNAFAELPSEVRSIVLQKVTGAKFTEIAAGLGIREYCVRRAYHRAMSLVREAIEARKGQTV